MPPPRFGTVVFDCDSTLSAIEGIDALAASHREEIAALTASAMRGTLPLEAVYGARLARIRPDRHAVAALGEAYIAAAVPGARETIHALRSADVEIRILSGGLRQAILPFARWLGLVDAAVAAVDIEFDEAGEYAGYDEGCPLARSGGKRAIIEEWRRLLPGPFLMVGDGVTDLEARPVVDRFVAFAGVVERLAVTEAADAVIRERSLLPVLREVLHTDTG